MRKLSLYYFDWLLLLWLTLTIGYVLCGAACVCLGSEVPQWQVRAAAAIAIHNANQGSRPIVEHQAGLDVLTKPPANKRPIVRMYSATWCVPCQRAKAELQGHALPFDLQIVDVSQGGQPDWCESIPAFAWEVRGQTRYVLGFPGMKKLIASWNATRGERDEPRIHDIPTPGRRSANMEVK